MARPVWLGSITVRSWGSVLSHDTGQVHPPYRGPTSMPSATCLMRDLREGREMVQTFFQISGTGPTIVSAENGEGRSLLHRTEKIERSASLVVDGREAKRRAAPKNPAAAVDCPQGSNLARKISSGGDSISFLPPPARLPLDMPGV